MLAEELRALVFAVWAALHPGPLPADADPIADALVAATLQRAGEAPALGSLELDLATMAVYVEGESQIHVEPQPWSWDARGRISCGMLQERCDFVRFHSLADQASRWLQLARWGAQVCPDSPLAPLSSGSCRRGRKLADERVARARAILQALADVVQEE